jgi:NADH-quinone oxidoreductase subunit G
VALWNHGQEVFRVTARKNKYDEVEEYICNECRYEHKDIKDWVVEGPRKIDRHSVISQNLFEAPYQRMLGGGNKREIPGRKDLLNPQTEESNS